MNCTPDQIQVAQLTPDGENEARIFRSTSFFNHNLPLHINNNSTPTSWTHGEALIVQSFQPPLQCISLPPLQCITATSPVHITATSPVHITARSNGSPYTVSFHHPHLPHLYNMLSSCMAIGSDVSIKRGDPFINSSFVSGYTLCAPSNVLILQQTHTLRRQRQGNSRRFGNYILHWHSNIR